MPVAASAAGTADPPTHLVGVSPSHGAPVPARSVGTSRALLVSVLIGGGLLVVFLTALSVTMLRRPSTVETGTGVATSANAVTTTASTTTTSVATITTPPTTVITTPETTLPPTTAVPPPTAAPPTSALPGDWQLTTDGVGPLRFGDSVAKAEAASGRRAQTNMCGGGDGSMQYISDAQPGLTLWFTDGRLVEYGADDPRNATPAGGRVGMAVTELKAKIPYATRESGPHLTDVMSVRSEGNIIIFFIENERVIGISGGLDGSAGFGC